MIQIIPFFTLFNINRIWWTISMDYTDDFTTRFTEAVFDSTNCRIKRGKITF
jgi:hypothetical protein